MANPIRLFIVPNCGLELTFPEVDPSSNEDPTKYRITNLDSPHFFKYFGSSASSNNLELGLEGWMSPVADVTLPPKIMTLAGIPPNATRYAFIHPPDNLGNIINWNKVKLNSDHKRFLERCNQATCDHEKRALLLEKQEWSIPWLAIFGGYVYFDGDDPIAVNPLALLETNFVLNFAGPYHVKKEASKEMKVLNRVHPIPIDVFRENFFVGLGVTGPNEVFLSTEEGNKGVHGSLIFYRDNGTALVYTTMGAVSTLDASGDISSIQDAFEEITRTAINEERFIFAPPYELTSDDLEESRRKYIMRILSNDERQLEDFGLEDPMTILHVACRVGCDEGSVIKLLQLELGSSRKHHENAKILRMPDLLKYKDIHGWLPLHYACRFCPKNISLIKFLINGSGNINGCREAVVTPDPFSRFPLHIALDSGAPAEVIRTIIESDTYGVAMNALTQNLKRSPFHIAANRGVDRDVFMVLLEADKDGEVLHRETVLGCTPLQMGIERKLHHSIIEVLLTSKKSMKTAHEGPVEIVRVRTNEAETINDEFKSENSINQLISKQFNGMIPLQHACLNNSSPETIKVLLDHDSEAKETIDRRLEMDKVMATSQVALADMDGMVPLHLALIHGNRKIIALLLQAERSKTRLHRYESTLYCRDAKNRVPLHIACQRAADEKTMKQLLDLDYTKETTHAVDDCGSVPLHYASDEKHSNGHILSLLIGAEDEFTTFLKSSTCTQMRSWRSSILESRGSNQARPRDFPLEYGIYHKLFHTYRSRPCSYKLDNEKKSPLFHAVASESGSDTIQPLLKPGHLCLKGFDSLVGELAGVLQTKGNERLRGHLIDELSKRRYFCLMLMDIYVHAIALIAYVISTEKFFSGNVQISEVLVIWVCIAINFIRECIRFKAQKSSYLLDIWSWSEITSIFLLTMSNIHFTNEVENPSEEISSSTRRMMTLSGVFLVLNLLFYLRTTFSPFARFVGGLLIICFTLIPFFVVSFLVLLAFAFGFRMSGTRGDSCDTLGNCFYFVMQSFFAGADDTTDYLDILYGILVIVVLLNVVIAIVEQAWEEAAKETGRLFWTYRLEFLTENRAFASAFVSKSDTKASAGKLSRILDRIDSVENIAFSNYTSWTKPPFNSVKSREMYEKPHDFFQEPIASMVKATHSAAATLYWIKTDSKELEAAKVGGGELYWMRVKVILRFIYSSIVYLILIILGVLTCGWFWPVNARKAILTVGLVMENEHEEPDSDQHQGGKQT